MNDNVVVLNEIYKTLEMGIIGIQKVKEKINDSVLLKEIVDAKKKYQAFISDIKKIIKNYDEEPDKINPLIKVGNELYTDIELISITDSKIVKMLMEGSNKGIIKLQELKNNANITDKNIKNILLEVLELLEYQVSAWKKYL